MRALIFTCLFMLCCSVDAAPAAHPCSKDALAQAKKLLTFHFGPDNRMEIDKTATLVAPLVNPVNKKQKFDVLEVWGNIYKGRYRMHFIYAQLPGSCTLMGQEILEFANL